MTSFASLQIDILNLRFRHEIVLVDFRLYLTFRFYNDGI